ncbi:hypothetical protein CHGG_09385 [Chaetomium globosum CBS 148.51]|uniref:Cutinase n=1 Tax=Chaetomium globosum (strain ATCC 6205 / CBS 148.51 / DSM 1962 / NBRC 6347 / NRRL 1970) TaxID=306901 RepID=Q2GRL9_CHAGB|nr:uncharacterized protein CHGG_09385 [Chaetomium globosum CBS 148.51]EAQ85371.1 hypothetical protein CHGG_09385 [Chaetomium globosum CBS 148.51]
MKFLTLLSAAGLAAALPAASPPTEQNNAAQIEARQLSSTRNDLVNGNSANCPSVIFIFARASGEPGNMRRASSRTSSPRARRGAPSTKPSACSRWPTPSVPNAAVVAGGYSQGTAVMSNSLSELSGAVQDQVKGVVLFGYTKNLQNVGRIPNYPRDRTEVYCNVSDAVCWGTLFIAPAHFLYTTDSSIAGAAVLEGADWGLSELGVWGDGEWEGTWREARGRRWSGGWDSAAVEGGWGLRTALSRS